MGSDYAHKVEGTGLGLSKSWDGEDLGERSGQGQQVYIYAAYTNRFSQKLELEPPNRKAKGQKKSARPVSF